jgi:hypothetical protein
MHYRARWAVHQFSGYCLFFAEIKKAKSYRWAGAELRAGRCDTLEEAYGLAWRALRGMRSSEVYEDAMPSWPKIRQAIKNPSDGARRWTEGLASWGMWGTEAEKRELAEEGRAFKARIDAAAEKARLAREEKTRADPLYPEFRAAHGDRPDGFAHWKYGREMEERARLAAEQAEREGAERHGAEAWARMKAEAAARKAEEDAYARAHTAEDWLRRYGHRLGFDRAYTELGLVGIEPIGDVTRAYRRLAAIHHPDKGGDPAEFVRIRKAYEAIKGRA